MDLGDAPFKYATSLEGLQAGVTPWHALRGQAADVQFRTSVIRNQADVERAWDYALKALAETAEIIVEAFIDFDYEITLSP